MLDQFRSRYTLNKNRIYQKGSRPPKFALLLTCYLNLNVSFSRVTFVHALYNYNHLNVYMKLCDLIAYDVKNNC